MKFLEKNYKYLILLLLCVASILYLTQSYSKKIEKIESKLLIVEKEKLSVENNLKLEIEKNIKLTKENQKKNKKTKISVIKSADGSVKKDIEIVENEEKSKSDLTDASKTNIDNTVQIENEKDKVINVENKSEKVEVKKSNWSGILFFIGGIAICLTTGLCVL